MSLVPVSKVTIDEYVTKKDEFVAEKIIMSVVRIRN